MKRTKLFLLTLGAAFVMVSCNPLNKMIKNASLVKYEVVPDPITLKGDHVEVTINGKFPPEYFNKKVKAEIIPVLKYPAESSDPTTKELKSIVLIGESLEGEGEKITWEKGGSFSYTDKFKYTKEMETAVLDFTTTGYYKSKTKALPNVKVADGTVITQLLVKGDEKPILGKDKFTRTIPVTKEADIHYLINSPQVRTTELRQEDIKSLTDFIDSAEVNRIKIKQINVTAYASPDGEQLRNENLADNRAESAVKAIQRVYKNLRIDEGMSDDLYSSAGKGEDWDGFKAAMEKSQIEDRDLIIRILQMYTDPDKREKEIKNISKTYVEISKKILPDLRRSVISVDAEKTGYSDEELKNLSQNSPEVLNIEEMLKAATLFEDLNTKLTIYKRTAQQFPEDWRGANNVGYVYFMQNKLGEAKAEFEKASSIKDSPEVNNNLGAISRLMGDNDKAKEFYAKASGAGPEYSYNQGILNIMEGDYTAAVSNLKAVDASFNLALAQLLNASPDESMKIVDQSEEKGEALGYYLKAIASMRSGKPDAAVTNLQEAIKKDGSLKEKAQKDAEFIKLREDNGFTNLVN